MLLNPYFHLFFLVLIGLFSNYQRKIALLKIGDSNTHKLNSYDTAYSALYDAKQVKLNRILPPSHHGWVKDWV